MKNVVTVKEQLTSGTNRRSFFENQRTHNGGDRINLDRM